MLVTALEHLLTASEHLLTAPDHTRNCSVSPTYGSAEGPPRVVENRNLLSHPDDLRKEAYLIRMT